MIFRINTSVRRQFLRVAKHERGVVSSPSSGKLIWNGNFVRQQHCQWMLFPEFGR